jgi:hypothetical protein
MKKYEQRDKAKFPNVYDQVKDISDKVSSKKKGYLPGQYVLVENDRDWET